jgi:hypothetical protein
MRDVTGEAHPLDPEDYDWRCAFELAGPEPPKPPEEWEIEAGYTHYPHNTPHVQACDKGVEVSTAEFTRADVAAVEAYSNGENDGPDWLCLGRLKDSRWFMLRAGCDYTGWDCRSGGLVDVAPDRETLIKYGCTNEELQRLGLPENTMPVRTEVDW